MTFVLCCSLGWLGALLALAAVSATTSAIVLYGLLSADADLGLLLRGKHKPDAFRGNVIWVTGASQVRAAVVRYLLRIAGRRPTKIPTSHQSSTGSSTSNSGIAAAAAAQ
jgi:hypothetical protein